MAFKIASQTVKPGIVRIDLIGELDAGTAPVFKAEIEKAAAQQAKRVVLMAGDLEYMASAGVRVLVFAKQKMGTAVDIFVVCPQESIRETLQLTGLEQSLVVLDEYNAAQIEAV